MCIQIKTSVRLRDFIALRPTDTSSVGYHVILNVWVSCYIKRVGIMLY